MPKKRSHLANFSYSLLFAVLVAILYWLRLYLLFLGPFVPTGQPLERLGFNLARLLTSIFAFILALVSSYVVLLVYRLLRSYRGDITDDFTEEQNKDDIIIN